ncbi:hypothetical protein ACHHYP_08971 [Achlya hypogyna]|uniref:FYVE-type domain-containing protein n=1 Tax=Achlya hypogyna TaxID=1202772 RepID=A0A1V9YNM0_ACHHY|nr:hypothetical protein ACHHYP_08971 [Achlya hypogyna]
MTSVASQRRLSRMSITIPPPLLSPTSRPASTSRASHDLDTSNTRLSSGRLSTLSTKEYSDDDDVRACSTCHEKFTVFRHRYACHYCSLVVCRKCSIALRDVGADAVLLPASNEIDDATEMLSPLSPQSASDVSTDSALLSMSSRYSTASNSSPSGRRRLRERCCKSCAVFTSTSKAPKECQVCHEGLTVLKKKTKCHVCQRFACRKCGDNVDPIEFELTPDDLDTVPASKSKKTEKTGVFVCTECITGHFAAKERRLAHCYVCNSKFQHFQRKCTCHACHQLMCLQCSFIVGSAPADNSVLTDIRECKPCHEKALAAKHATLARSAPSSSPAALGLSLHSAFEFSKAARSSALGGSLQAFERHCAMFFMLVGVVTVVAGLLVAYYVCFASFVPQEWVLSYYGAHPEL